MVEVEKNWMLSKWVWSSVSERVSDGLRSRVGMTGETTDDDVMDDQK